jgi:hypothetical protein
MAKFNVKSEDEYGLFARHKDDPTKGEWLEDTKNLSVYKKLAEKVSANKRYE